MDRLPPLLPSPFFTFHMPLPNQRMMKRPRHSAPVSPGTIHGYRPHGSSTASFKPFSNTFIPLSSKRTKSYQSPLDLPSSDAIEPAKLQLQDEDTDMMDLDLDDGSPVTESDDPFL